MKRNRRFVLSTVLIVGFIALIVWFRYAWIVSFNSDERIPGRDTVAFWNLKEEGLVYEITHFGGRFDFAMDDSPSAHVSGCEIENVHFYANTTDYIFIITLDNLCYSVEKKTGTISSSPMFDLVPAAEEQVSFINLLNEKSARISKDYR